MQFRGLRPYGEAYRTSGSSRELGNLGFHTPPGTPLPYMYTGMCPLILTVLYRDYNRGPRIPMKGC